MRKLQIEDAEIMRIAIQQKIGRSEEWAWLTNQAQAWPAAYRSYYWEGFETGGDSFKGWKLHRIYHSRSDHLDSFDRARA